MTEISLSRVVSNALNDLEPGFPLYKIRPPWPRGDRELSIDQFYDSLLAEGKRMGPIESINIGNNRSILVFNTSAGSTHTPLRVPYSDFDKEYRDQAEEHGLEVPDGPLIQISQSGESNSPSIVPLDMLVWTILKDETGRLMPIDLNDFTTKCKAKDDGLIDPLAPENKFKLKLDEDKITEIFTHVHHRGDIARKTFLNLFNNKIRQAITRSTLCGEAPLFPEKKLGDILQGIAVGYYRGDELKGYEQFGHDHLGMGPMSNPTAHYRVIAHLPMEVINRLNLNSTRASFDDIMLALSQRQQYFDTSIELIHTKPDLFANSIAQRDESGVLKKLLEEIDPYDILKLIDPYASLACDILNPWLEQQFRDVFGNFAVDVRQFQHNGGEYDRELRSTQGIEVIVPSAEFGDGHNAEIKARMYARAVQVIGERVAPMWTDIKRLVGEKVIMSDQDIEHEIQMMQKKYGLPDKAIELMKRIKPTERQLKNTAKREDLTYHQKMQVSSASARYHEENKIHNQEFERTYYKITKGKGTLDDLSKLITSLQKLQLYDSDWNQGYNIPGVPSFAITHNRHEDGNYHMMIGWLLSKKGLSEAWLGGILSRPL